MLLSGWDAGTASLLPSLPFSFSLSPLCPISSFGDPSISGKISEILADIPQSLSADRRSAMMSPTPSSSSSLDLTAPSPDQSEAMGLPMELTVLLSIVLENFLGAPGDSGMRAHPEKTMVSSVSTLL